MFLVGPADFGVLVYLFFRVVLFRGNWYKAQDQDPWNGSAPELYTCGLVAVVLQNEAGPSATWTWHLLQKPAGSRETKNGK